MAATLVVTRNPTPQVNIPLSEQIQRFGETSSPSAIVAYPASQFSFSFARDTFSYAGDGLNYYATSADNSPLPSWIKFDAGSLTFTGRTPPFESLLQPPQKFDFQLVGSDIIGFSAVSILFSIVVGVHRLTTDTPIININATWGTEVSYQALASSIRFDGETVSPAELTLSVSELPSWLSVDNATLEIQGTPPEDARSSNSTLTFRDSYSNTLEILLSVSFAMRILRQTDLDFAVTPGRNFSFNLEPYLWTPSDVELELGGAPAGWIQVDGLVVSGTPPSSAPPGDVRVILRATSKSSGDFEQAAMTLEILPAPATTSTAPTPSASPTGNAAGDSGQGLKAGYIALAILLPLLLLFAIVILIILCRRRRRRIRNPIREKLKNREISQPIPGTFVFVEGHSRNDSYPSTFELKKPEPEENRYSQIGYFNNAVQRLKHSRTLSTITGSRLSQSNNRTSSNWRESDQSQMLTSASYGSSWLTEGVPFQPRHAQQLSTSTYDGPSEALSGSSGFLQGQRDDSYRSILDVTIPSMDDETASIQATPDLAYNTPWNEPINTRTINTVGVASDSWTEILALALAAAEKDVRGFQRTQGNQPSHHEIRVGEGQHPATEFSSSVGVITAHKQEVRLQSLLRRSVGRIAPPPLRFGQRLRLAGDRLSKGNGELEDDLAGFAWHRLCGTNEEFSVLVTSTFVVSATPQYRQEGLKQVEAQQGYPRRKAYTTVAADVNQFKHNARGQSTE
ncbi:Axial budding pattern protein 2 [Colletotrichum chlorophyti]|uniref:Axial budding pattern protein 2 n=1 Tax=Colletotrichum chlorophyti TaxID=708187 RepID=A0A1Q8RNL2_9PEZI|nr:Axial budding pattern protein 2 [Colletotrichum chlorophyti]